MQTDGLSISLRSGEGGRAGKHRWRGGGRSSGCLFFARRTRCGAAAMNVVRKGEGAGVFAALPAQFHTFHVVRACRFISPFARGRVRYGMKERGGPPAASGAFGRNRESDRGVSGGRVSDDLFVSRPGGKRCGSSVPCARSRKLPRRKRICLKKAGRVRSGYEAARVRRPAAGPERPTLVLIRRGKADGESFPTCRNRPISGRCRRAWP